MVDSVFPQTSQMKLLCMTRLNKDMTRIIVTLYARMMKMNYEIFIVELQHQRKYKGDWG